MSAKLAKIASLIAGTKENIIGKLTKGVVIAIISPFIAITLIIGGIFADGINFNHQLIAALFEGDPLGELLGEQAEYLRDIQNGLILISSKIESKNNELANGATLNEYQVKGYYIGLMFTDQKMIFDEEKAGSWVNSFTIEIVENQGTEDETSSIVPTSVNKTIYSQIEENLAITLNDETKMVMEQVYGSLIGNENGIVTTLSEEELNELLKNLPANTSQLRKDIVIQASDAVGKIPYYWGGTASAPGYDGNDFGKTVKADEKGRTKKGLDCSHFVDWVYWTVMNNNLENTNTKGQIKMCNKISKDELLPGDLAFLINKKGETTHVGIYAGKNEKGEMVWIHENSHDNNVGRYADVEIVHSESYEILFDTYGQYINRIWPELSTSDRYNFNDTINRMAGHLQNIMNREEDPTPLDKVRQFMIDTLGMEKVKSNDEFIKSIMEEQTANIEMKMYM